MTYALNEPFNDPQGRWNEYAPWDGTEASDADKGFLTTQRHVDLRSFRLTIPDPAPQDPHLDSVPQTVLDAWTQTQMEVQEAVNDENWILAGSGLDPFTVGAIPERGGWPGLQAPITGAISATLTSSMTTALDISPMDFISMVMPDINNFDPDNSFVQLTSNPTGVFTDSDQNSVLVAFSYNSDSMPHLKLAMDLFTSGAGINYNNQLVTGIQITLERP